MTREARMKKILLAGSVAAMLALTGCAQVSGEITEKEVEVTYRKKRVNTCYEFEIKQADGTVTDICVTKSEYDRYNVGDKYP